MLGVKDRATTKKSHPLITQSLCFPRKNGKYKKILKNKQENIMLYGD